MALMMMIITTKRFIELSYYIPMIGLGLYGRHVYTQISLNSDTEAKYD